MKKFNPFRVATSSPILIHGFHPRLLLFNPFRVVTHGTFNGTKHLTQGGKFEHGFFSGFVSSLGGSYMMGIDNRAAQVVMSAAIGGTAEALGGGKFANGAVTGAYVMMFNHLGHDWRERKASFKMKVLAVTIRSQPNFGPNTPNPFYGADAIFFDGGGLLVGAELMLVSSLFYQAMT